MDETIVLDWTVAIEALDYHSVQELLDIQPTLLWTPLAPSAHLETDFSHFVERLKDFKLLGNSIRPLYALHHILFDYGIEGDEWAEDRNELIDFILKKSTIEELDSNLWGEEQNTIMHLAHFLNRPELIQLLQDKGLDETKKNRLGNLPIDNDQPKIIINKEKKDEENKPSATSDRFRRLRELAESPNNIKNKSKERQNSTRRYFRPGHLEELKRRVLSEEEEAELKEKERQNRQKEVEKLAQRSAVKNNPLFKKFEGQQEESVKKKEKIQTKAAETSVKDKAKFLNAGEQAKRSSRVINILKDRSVVSTSVFRQQTDTQLPKKVPSLRTLKAAKDPAKKKEDGKDVITVTPSTSTATLSAETIKPSTSTPSVRSIQSTPSVQSVPDDTSIIKVVDENETKEPTITIQDEESTTPVENNISQAPVPIIDTTNIETLSNESQNPLSPFQEPGFDLNLSPTEFQDKKQRAESDKFVLASGRKITIVKKKGNVKKIINVHENLKEEEKVENYSTGKIFRVWKKDGESLEIPADEYDPNMYVRKESVDMNSLTLLPNSANQNSQKLKPDTIEEKESDTENTAINKLRRGSQESQDVDKYKKPRGVYKKGVYNLDDPNVMQDGTSTDDTFNNTSSDNTVLLEKADFDKTKDNTNFVEYKKSTGEKKEKKKRVESTLDDLYYYEHLKKEDRLKVNKHNQAQSTIQTENELKIDKPTPALDENTNNGSISKDVHPITDEIKNQPEMNDNQYHVTLPTINSNKATYGAEDDDLNSDKTKLTSTKNVDDGLNSQINRPIGSNTRNIEIVSIIHNSENTQKTKDTVPENADNNLISYEHAYPHTYQLKDQSDLINSQSTDSQYSNSQPIVNKNDNPYGTENSNHEIEHMKGIPVENIDITLDSHSGISQCNNIKSTKNTNENDIQLNSYKSNETITSSFNDYHNTPTSCNFSDSTFGTNFDTYESQYNKFTTRDIDTSSREINEDIVISEENKEDTAIKEETKKGMNIMEESKGDTAIKEETKEDTAIKEETKNNTAITEEAKKKTAMMAGMTIIAGMTINEEAKENVGIKKEAKEDVGIKEEAKEDSAIIEENKESMIIMKEAKEDMVVIGKATEDTTIIEDTKEDTVIMEENKESMAIMEENKEGMTIMEGNKESITVMGGAREDATIIEENKEGMTIIEGNKESITVMGGAREDATIIEGNKEGMTIMEGNKKSIIVMGEAREDATIIEENKEGMTIMEGNKESITVMGGAREDATIMEENKEVMNIMEDTKGGTTVKEEAKEDMAIMKEKEESEAKSLKPANLSILTGINIATKSNTASTNNEENSGVDSNRFSGSDEEDEGVIFTPTNENPYGKKGNYTENTTSYEQLINEKHGNFREKDVVEYQNIRKDHRPSFFSEKHKSVNLQNMEFESDSNMLTLAEVNSDANTEPDFLSKPYTSNKEIAASSEKRKSGSQRNHWSVGINMVDKVPARQSVAITSEAGSEQWFDPETDWAEEKPYSGRSSMTSNSLKHSSSTENTTIEEDEEIGSAKKETRELTKENVEAEADYHSSNLYKGKQKSYTSSNNEEVEGEIVIFMQSNDQENIQTKLEEKNNTTTTIVDREKIQLDDESEFVSNPTNQPRIEDISHYMNALPKTQDTSMYEETKQTIQAAAEKSNIPNAHELTEHALSAGEITQTKCGKIYIGVSGAHDVLLPLPKEITYARCVISDGEYEYMSRYEMLGERILMDYECVIDSKPGTIITVSLHVRPDYHVKPRSGWTKWFTSIRKQKEHLSGYVHPEDGAIGQTRFAVDHMVPACYKKTYAANFDCFNSWYTRSSKERARREQFGDEEDFLKIVGRLNIEMLYLPVSGPSAQVPKSLRECDLTLKIRQWHDTCWQNGYLSIRVQGQKIWQRHYYKLVGSQLIGYVSGEEGEVWNHYNIADVIRLSAAADKVIVTLVEQETNDDKVFGAESIIEGNLKGFFRLSFPDYHLDCVSDNVSESEEWVKTLKSMIGRVPLRLPFTDYY